MLKHIWMKKLYSIALILSFLLVNAQAYTGSYALLFKGLSTVDTAKKVLKSTTKITDTRKEKPDYLQNGINISLTPFKPVATKPAASNANSPAQNQATNASAAKSTQAESKILNNVKVYPNPVAEQLNLSYNVTKESNVTIKIMDVLGNEIATLLSQRMPAGEQTNSFSIASKLGSGYYFIRLVVGNETVVKRISIL